MYKLSPSPLDLSMKILPSYCHRSFITQISNNHINLLNRFALPLVLLNLRSVLVVLGLGV